MRDSVAQRGAAPSIVKKRAREEAGALAASESNNPLVTPASTWQQQVALSEFLATERRNRETFAQRCFPNEPCCRVINAYDYKNLKMVPFSWYSNSWSYEIREWAQEVAEGRFATGEEVIDLAKNFLLEIVEDNGGKYFFDVLSANAIPLYRECFQTEDIMPFETFILTLGVAWKLPSGEPRFPREGIREWLGETHNKILTRGEAALALA